MKLIILPTSFLTGNNSILIEKRKDFEDFIEILKIYKSEIKNPFENCDDPYKYFVEICDINNMDPDNVCFEYMEDKGLTFGMTKEESKDWYGKEPIKVS